MQGELRTDFRIIEVAQLAERKSVAVSNFRDEFLTLATGDGTLHEPACRVDVVDYIQGGGVFSHLCEAAHQPADVLGVVEISCPDILDFDHYGAEPLQGLLFEGYVVGARSELGVVRRKDHLEVAPFPE